MDIVFLAICIVGLSLCGRAVWRIQADARSR